MRSGKTLAIAMLILVILLGIALGTGLLTPAEHESEVTELLEASEAEVWKLLTSLDSISAFGGGIAVVEVTGINELGLETWKETDDEKSVALYEFLEKVPEEVLRVKMSASSYGMTGTWVYEMVDENGRCRLTIKEQSTIKPVRYRTLLAIAGRQSYLRNQMGYLKFRLGE